MKNTIELLLHIPCDEIAFSDTNSIPLFLRGVYHLKVLRIADTSFLLVVPKEKVNLANMRKHRERLMEIVDMECAF